MSRRVEGPLHATLRAPASHVWREPTAYKLAPGLLFSIKTRARDTWKGGKAALCTPNGR
jgi:hypothetical protein